MRCNCIEQSASPHINNYKLTAREKKKHNGTPRVYHLLQCFVAGHEKQKKKRKEKEKKNVLFCISVHVCAVFECECVRAVRVWFARDEGEKNDKCHALSILNALHAHNHTEECWITCEEPTL